MPKKTRKTSAEENTIIIKPQPGPQSQFLASSADIVFYGGAAGGGKTWATIVEPLRHIHVPGFTAALIRESYRQIMQPGGLLSEAEKLYPLLGGKPKNGGLDWIFPSGARISFSYLGHANDKHKFQGSSLCLIVWDELCHQPEDRFVYLASRNRSTCGVKPYIRATMNPDSDSWVARFISWWLDDRGYADPAKSGKVRWFIREGSEVIWADSKEELELRYPGSLPKSFTFIKSDVYDNKILLERDPGYLANLKSLHPVEKERLLKGNWLVNYTPGSVFHRDWFEIVESSVVEQLSWRYGYEEVRFWDLAATDADFSGADPSATSGTRMRLILDGSNTVYILDSINRLISPGEVNTLIRNTALQDGNLCKIRWEIEPGSASIRNTHEMIGFLSGYDALGMLPAANKVVRAKPLATAAYQGKVKLVRGLWNDRWLKSAVNFPNDPKGKESKAEIGPLGVKERAGNDDIDSAAGAYSVLTHNTAVYREHKAVWSR